MFNYYGGKSKLAHLYPFPRYHKVIEPFAGSARYSLHYWTKEIQLYDKSQEVINIWHYLQNVTEEELRTLYIPKKGEDIRELPYTNMERLFLSYLVDVSAGKRYKVSSFGAQNLQSFHKKISNVHKCRSWSIQQGDYRDIPNQEATWFIDPPYFYGGEHYKHSSKHIDYQELAEWCKTRKGQVIVCENTKANWLDFMPLIEFSGAVHTTTEAIWTNYPTSYGVKQLTLEDEIESILTDK